MNFLLLLLPLFIQLIHWLTSLEKSGQHLTEHQKEKLREARAAASEFMAVCTRMGVDG